MIRQHNATTSASIGGGQNTPGQGTQGCGRGTRISDHEIKLSKSLFAVVFAFMICWVVCMFLLYFSNTINPFIYAGMNPPFRREFRKILVCKRLRKLVASSEGRAKCEDVETQSSQRQHYDNQADPSSVVSFPPYVSKTDFQIRLEELEMSTKDISNTNNNYNNVIIFV